MTARAWRRLSQSAIFLIFLFLFLQTEYKDNDILPYAVNIFLRFDPLVAGAAMLAGRALISLVWPALVTIGLTLILGRFFCGWICPLGSLLDFTSATVWRGRRRKEAPDSWRAAKYLILIFLLGSSLFTLQFVFLLDPLSLLIRSFTLSVYPAFNVVLNGTFGLLWSTGLRPLTVLSEPAYSFLKEHLLAFSQPFYRMTALVGILFASILALEIVQRRFWCRNLCPLGALFGILGRVAPLRRWVSEPDCAGCAACRRECRMGAVAPDFVGTDDAECIRCLDCRGVCPERAVRFPWKPASAHHGEVSLTRRSALGALGLGLVSVPLLRSESSWKIPDRRVIRPPGALAERPFLGRCTRCGECMRVCPENGLQPTFLEAGLEGLWSPILIPRLGYCEYNCTLCGQVCPTGAIRRLPVDRKRKLVIGLAEIDRNRCLPWKGESDCIVCEEMCPTGEKAIKLRSEEAMGTDGIRRLFKRPYVDEKLCVGCGICENKCPLVDRAAIVVTSRGESRATGEPS